MILRGGIGSSGSPMAVMGGKAKPALTVELGGMCATMPDQFHRSGRTLADAIGNVMRSYGMTAGVAASAGTWFVGVQ